ncbi:MAG: universal stress protein [Flavobacteriales bacterium]|nr:universal stress protein [Flavobacteriales bacterium]
MHTILIPLDFSEASVNAAKYAIALLRNQPTEFICLNVLDFRQPIGSLGSMRDKMEKGIRADLDRAYDKITEGGHYPGHSFNKVIIHDTAADGITNYAEKVDAKAIFMGTTGASGIKEILMGSVAAGVIRKAKCPVMTIPKEVKYENIDVIALATDFKPIKNMESYQFLINILNLCKAHLVVINVDDKEQPVNMETAMSGLTLDKRFGEIPHRYEFLKGDDTVDSLIDFVKEEKIGMITMIHHSYKLLEKLFKRSSVEKVAMQTTIPLLSLPELS